MYRNNGDGTFTSVGPEINMDDGDQSWATVFEDFDNDGDFDAFTVNHQFANRFMENDGTGMYTDIIGTTGINASDLGAWNCDAADFDNNGFVDIFSEMDNEMYWNNGDGTFTGGNLNFSSGGIGDFNHDGFLDVIRGNTIFLNQTNNNNWVKFDLEGIVSNKEGIGARIEIYGDWGVQIREVRAGRSFDPASSLIAHFGLGTATEIDQVIVRWPSGMVTSLQNPAINTQLNIIESSCTLDPIEIAVSGNTEICEGQTVSLSAPEGNSYAWSNGSNTQSIEVSQDGNYSVYVFDEEGCVATSNTVNVEVVQETTPVVSVLGETYFCAGGSVQLAVSGVNNATWNTGAEGNQLEVTASGDYYVSAVGICTGNTLVSEPVSVLVNSPALPVVEDVQIGEPGSVELTATGTNVEWFASETSTEVLASGNSFNTPIVEEQASYWVQNTVEYPGEEEFGGKPTIDGGGGLPSQGGILFFNVTEAFTLQQVTCVVPANGVAGTRTLIVRDASNNEIGQATFFLDLGETVVDVNIDIPVGDGYQILCPENNLFRNNSGVSYPYAIGTVGEITNSSFGTSYYYYFYNWKIQKESMTCVSPRVEVSVSVVGIDELSSNPFGLSAFPNPTNGALNVSVKSEMNNAVMTITDAVGKMVRTEKLNIAGRGTQTIDVANLEAGVYHLTVSKDGMKSVIDFVVE